MITHGSVARDVRERKERHPEDYCRVKDCLWRTSSGPCQKHPATGQPARQSNIYERLARLEKAIDIADFLSASRITADQVREFDEFNWESVFEAVRRRQGETETRAEVIRLLEGREAWVERLAARR